MARGYASPTLAPALRRPWRCGSMGAPGSMDCGPHRQFTCLWASRKPARSRPARVWQNSACYCLLPQAAQMWSSRCVRTPSSPPPTATSASRVSRWSARCNAWACGWIGPSCGTKLKIENVKLRITRLQSMIEKREYSSANLFSIFNFQFFILFLVALGLRLLVWHWHALYNLGGDERED